MTQTTDVLVVGGGMAGASCAHFLALAGVAVTVLEREEQPGYHSTGRSAALFSETYGPVLVRKLSTASRPFLIDPPDGFTEHPLLAPRGLMTLGEPGQEEAIAAAVAAGRANGARVEALDGAQIRDVVPILREGVFVAGALEPDAMDIDVHALHQGFLRGLKKAGGRVVCDAEIVSAARENGAWSLRTRRGETFSAPVVVNAAGAWTDVVAELAGVAPLGLTPKRRTGIMIDLPAGVDARRWPLTGDLAETFYVKPDASRLMLSPADATPVPPQDVQPEELDVAMAIDRLMQVTTLEIGRPGETWAGLRSFVPDGEPTAGWAADADGFFWLAGQGGYGIQTAAGLGRFAAACVQGAPVPADLTALGLSVETLSPRRLSAAA